MLEVRNIETFYGNIQALKGIRMDVSEGEIVTLIGANGAGKSTTLMSISGIVPLSTLPDSAEPTHRPKRACPGPIADLIASD